MRFAKRIFWGLKIDENTFYAKNKNAQVNNFNKR